MTFFHVEFENHPNNPLNPIQRAQEAKNGLVFPREIRLLSLFAFLVLLTRNSEIVKSRYSRSFSHKTGLGLSDISRLFKIGAEHNSDPKLEISQGTQYTLYIIQGDPVLNS